MNDYNVQLQSNGTSLREQ